jgi:hypothetical protein
MPPLNIRLKLATPRTPNYGVRPWLFGTETDSLIGQALSLRERVGWGHDSTAVHSCPHPALRALSRGERAYPDSAVPSIQLPVDV